MKNRFKFINLFNFHSNSKNRIKNCQGTFVQNCGSIFTIVLIFVATFSLAGTSKDPILRSKNAAISFIENKGQVSDQFNKPRKDVLFSGVVNGMVYHLKQTGISYQLYKKIDSTQTNVYRLDVNWMRTNPAAKVVKDNSLAGYDHYYTTATGIPVTFVKSYEGVTYKSIYPDIDLRYYSKEGDLKYDFIVAPHANYKDIELELKGAEKITILSNGSVVCKTPYGEIIEGAPLAYQNGKLISSKWILMNNKLSFEIGNYDPSQSLLIDPAIRSWGTYYGAPTTQFLGTNGNGCTTDANGNVYFVGLTDAATGTGIATSGAHQSTIPSTTQSHGFLVKFNSAGVRQWGTYYGGNRNTTFENCKADALGNVYAVGSSAATNGVTTPGAHQVSISANAASGILVKFDAAGVRQWATYYGNDVASTITDVALDGGTMLYIVGRTVSQSGIASPGSHQTSFAGGTSVSLGDAFLAKFNTSGVRQWGTYFGGALAEWGYGVGADGLGNVYITGSTESTSGISTPGSHQSTYGTGMDGFIAKFNTTGNLQWGTYYGDVGGDFIRGCEVNAAGDFYGLGTTTSTLNIASAGAFQSTFSGGGPSGNQDAFLVKLDASGVRQWCTYFGAAGTDRGRECAIDINGNILIVGETASTSGIATPGNHQMVHAGGPTNPLQPFDAYIAKFNGSGSLTWATYYGGSGRDVASGCAVDNMGRIYLSGSTQSNGGTDIATTGAHQTSMGASNDAFIVQFTDCNGPNPPVNTTAASNQTVCSGNSATLSATASSTIEWFHSPTVQFPLSNGGTYVTFTLTSGTYTYYAQTSNTCSASQRTPITFTVSPLISVNSGSICAGDTFTIVPSGVTTFTFSNGTNIVMPTVNSSYTVTGTDASGCIGSAVSNITVTPTPTVSVSGGSVCLGSSFTLSPHGADTYTFSSGNAVVSPTSTTSYTVTGSSLNGCTNLNGTVASVTVMAIPALTAVSNRTMMCRKESAKLSANGANTYSWSNGSSSTSISISPTVTTSYTVVGTGSNSCVNKVVLTQSVSICADLESENSAIENMKIYPNPNNGIFNLSSNVEFNRFMVEIYNPLGQLVFKNDTKSNEVSIDISNQSNGIYIIKVINNESKSKVFKILKD